MRNKIGLESLERDSYIAYYRDGILDLLVGLALLGMSLFIIIGDADMGALLPVVAILLHPVLKKFVTQPRLGYVKFAPHREAQLVYSGDSNWQLWTRSLGAIPVGLVLAAAAAALAILYSVSRSLVYALVILVVFVLGHILRIHISMQLLFIGAMLAITGAVLLLRFVKRYPKLSLEPSNEA